MLPGGKRRARSDKTLGALRKDCRRPDERGVAEERPTSGLQRTETASAVPAAHLLSVRRQVTIE
jgi:hypothetical protein